MDPDLLPATAEREWAGEEPGHYCLLCPQRKGRCEEVDKDNGGLVQFLALLEIFPNDPGELKITDSYRMEEASKGL